MTVSDEMRSAFTNVLSNLAAVQNAQEPTNAREADIVSDLLSESAETLSSLAEDYAKIATAYEEGIDAPPPHAPHGHPRDAEFEPVEQIDKRVRGE